MKRNGLFAMVYGKEEGEFYGRIGGFCCVTFSQIIKPSEYEKKLDAMFSVCSETDDFYIFYCLWNGKTIGTTQYERICHNDYKYKSHLWAYFMRMLCCLEKMKHEI